MEKEKMEQVVSEQPVEFKHFVFTLMDARTGVIHTRYMTAPTQADATAYVLKGTVHYAVLNILEIDENTFDVLKTYVEYSNMQTAPKTEEKPEETKEEVKTEQKPKTTQSKPRKPRTPKVKADETEEKKVD